MIPYLKKSDVEINGKKIGIRQLSGLERFDFLDFVSMLEYPKKLQELDNNVTQDEMELYLVDMHNLMREISKTTFQGQSRLVAYGIDIEELDSSNIDERQRWVMSSFSAEDIKILHDAIAVLSGMPLPDQEQSDESASDSEPAETEDTKNPKA
ncbi:TPA: hypothetical protein ACX6S2_003443 [Photobacterium damselae]